MRVGDDGSGAAPQDGATELGRADHRRFDVDVGVDQARTDVATAQVDLLGGLVGGAHSNDTVTGDGDVGFDGLPGEDVDHTPVAKKQVGRLVAPGDGKEAR